MQASDAHLPRTEAELIEKLRDPHWRLRNLYWIKDKDSNVVLFKPWPEQERFLANLWFRNIIVKARQRGFSTLIQLVMLDTCLFNPHIEAAVIAQDREAATGIFRGKIKFAYDRLPDVVRAMNPLTKETESELHLANGSSLQVSTSARSGTKQWLHVSEFGKICARFPLKATEIVTGSLPAVAPNGICVIESTAEGQDGAFHDMAMRAQALRDKGTRLANSDYRFHFAPWWDADEYEADPDRVVITSQDNAYFGRIEAQIGREIGPRKRAWYVSERDNTFSGSQEKMFQEYPSTPEEAFQRSTEGCYLAEVLALARRQGRITTVPHDPGRPVNTFWDLHHGGNDDVAIWFHQRVGLLDYWIKFLEFSGESYSAIVRTLQSLGYVWGKHYLPHDADRRFPGAETNPTIRDMLSELGLKNIEVVARVADVVAGINELRDDFGSYWFDEAGCKDGLAHLALYQKDWNERTGAWSDRPRANGHQHAADAIRQKAQGYRMPVSGPKRNRNRSAMAV